MRVRIPLLSGDLALETEAGWAEGGAAVPCHRCGLCCERWQPLLTLEDAARLAGHLGLASGAFLEVYTEPYPFDDEQRLLRREGGRCVFLRYEADGRATCAVHPARPQVCRDWAAGLDKQECVRGLARFAAPDGLIRIDDLYPGPEDRAAFTRAVYPEPSNRE